MKLALMLAGFVMLPSASLGSPPLSKIFVTSNTSWTVNPDLAGCRLNYRIPMDGKHGQVVFERRIFQTEMATKIYVPEKPDRPHSYDEDTTIAIDGVSADRSFGMIVKDEPPNTAYTFWTDHRADGFDQLDRQIMFENEELGNVSLVFEDFQEGWAALDHCVAGIRHRFGIEDLSIEDVAVLPEGYNYPIASMYRAGRRDELVVFHWVEASGRVTGCRVLHSTYDEKTNERLCKLMESRSRFEPARDFDGNKVRAPRVEDLTLNPTAK